MHDIGCRAIVEASRHAVQLLKLFEKNGKFKLYPQRQSGKVFSKMDFKPHHIRVAKWILENRYLEEYLTHKDSRQKQVKLLQIRKLQMN